MVPCKAYKGRQEKARGQVGWGTQAEPVIVFPAGSPQGRKGVGAQGHGRIQENWGYMGQGGRQHVQGKAHGGQGKACPVREIASHPINHSPKGKEGKVHGGNNRE